MSFVRPVVRSTGAYSISIAWVGHESTQAPQSAHNSPSITALFSFTSIAPQGHVSTQSPHPSHCSNFTIAAIHQTPEPRKCRTRKFDPLSIFTRLTAPSSTDLTAGSLDFHRRKN